MKTTNFFFVAVLFFLGFIACNEEMTTIQKEIPNANFRAFDENLDELVKNPTDKADEDIKKSNIQIAQVLFNLVTRADINDFIVKTAKANEGNVQYEQIFQQFPELKSLFKSTVLGMTKTLNEKLSQLGKRSDLSYDHVRNNFAYKSMIYVPNHKVCKGKEEAVISPELQLFKYEEAGEGDVIFAWDVKKNQVKK